MILIEVGIDKYNPNKAPTVNPVNRSFFVCLHHLKYLPVHSKSLLSSYTKSAWGHLCVSLLCTTI